MSNPIFLQISDRATRLLEYWRQVPGYEGLYEISNCGAVVSLPKFQRFNGTPVLRPARRLVPSFNDGYLVVGLTRDKSLRSFAVHRLVAAAFIGRRPQGMQTCHNDGTRTNNRLSNLRYDTALGNSADAKQHGRLKPAKGEFSCRAKLTAEQVDAIRADKRKQRDIAKDYGVSQSNVWRIKQGHIWDDGDPRCSAATRAEVLAMYDAARGSLDCIAAVEHVAGLTGLDLVSVEGVVQGREAAHQAMELA